MGRDVGYTTMIFRSFSPAPRPINYWEVMNHLKPDSETISNAKIAFSTVCKGREGRFKPWEVKGAFLRGSQSCGWACVVFLFSPLQGHWAALEASRWSIHSPCPMLTIQKSYDNNKSIFFFWGKLVCITRSTSKLYQAGFPQHLGAAEILMQIYNLALFQVVFLHTSGGEKTWYTTLFGFFVVFIKFFKISQNYTHYKLNLHIFQWKIEIS